MNDAARRSILDHPTISERYFFPRPDRPPEVLSVSCDGATLACAAHRPLAAAPTVIFFHGNGEVVADYVPWLCEAFAERGTNLLLAEYRGYGGSTGAPGLIRMLADVTQVFEAAALPPEQVIVFGRSVGSIYALELAAQQPGIAGLVIESGIADPLERVLMRVDPDEIGSDRETLAAEAREHLDHRRKLAAYGGPLLVLHARGDTLVDVTNGQRLAAWSAPPQTELLVLPRGDHNTIMMANEAAYWDALGGFLGRLPTRR
ncbi:MAG: alpha/beta fold hydrolase [Deltaproteobacteria bacterium]|nr:alpha/beta fold hydrolase [Deltaproteobacteria bacterium]